MWNYNFTILFMLMLPKPSKDRKYFYAEHLKPRKSMSEGTESWWMVFILVLFASLSYQSLWNNSMLLAKTLKIHRFSF